MSHNQSHIQSQIRRPKSPPPPLSQQPSHQQQQIYPQPHLSQNQDTDDTEDDTEYPEIPALSSEEEFIQAVKKWVAFDNQLHILNVRIKEIRETRNTITQQIHQYAEDKNLDYPSIEISDGELILCEKREYSSLSFSYIERCLSKLIQEPAHIERILNALRENRKCYLIPDIRRSKRTSSSYS
jgi:hypothetical protein